MIVVEKIKRTVYNPSNKKYLIAIVSNFLLLLIALLYLRFCVNSKSLSVAPRIEIADNLATKGYISFNISDSILVKVKITKEKIDKDTIDWHSVNNYLRSKDTLYPKSNCYIYIHSYFKEKNQTEYYNYSFNFDFTDFVQRALLNYQDDTFEQTVRDLLSDMENNPIYFDNGATDIEIIDSYLGVRNNIIGFISENPQLYKIDSISFYDTNDIQEKDFRIKKYPRIKYIKIR